MEHALITSTLVLIKITTGSREPAHGNETEWDVRAEKPLGIWISEFGGWGHFLCDLLSICVLLFCLLRHMAIGALWGFYFSPKTLHVYTEHKHVQPVIPSPVTADDLFVTCQQIRLKNTSQRRRFILSNHLTWLWLNNLQSGIKKKKTALVSVHTILICVFCILPPAIGGSVLLGSTNVALKDLLTADTLKRIQK